MHHRLEEDQENAKDTGADGQPGKASLPSKCIYSWIGANGIHKS